MSTFNLIYLQLLFRLPRLLNGKESACQCRRRRFGLWVGSPEVGNGDLSSMYSCLENPMDRGAWLATVQRLFGVTKSQTQLSNWAHTCYVHVYKNRSSLIAHLVKNLPAMQETWVRSLGQEDPLEKEMTTHSSGESHGQRSLAGYSPWGRKSRNIT